MKRKQKNKRTKKKIQKTKIKIPLEYF